MAEMQNDVDLYRAEVVAVAAYLHATLAAAEVVWPLFHTSMTIPESRIQPKARI